MRVALSIAASDSSGGAGIQADLAVFADLGVYGVCAVTNVTAQNSRGVMRVCKTPPRIVAAQIDAVTRDFQVSACKIGMLFAHQIVDIVADRISRRSIPNVVLDPVLRAKGGECLAGNPALKRLKRSLLPKVLLVTPNAVEAEALTGIPVCDVASAGDAAKALVEMGASAALVKGGHINGDPVDVFYDGGELLELTGNRLPVSMHGTGCVLSASIAARLALGDSLLDAVRFGKQYVTRAIERSIRLGKGEMTFFRMEN